MKKNTRITLAVVLILFFVPGVYGISVKMASGDAGGSVGSSTKFDVPVDGSLSLQATLGSGGKSLSLSISGNGELHDSHFVQSREGHRAELSIDIYGDAADYTYGYTLYPGEGYGGSSKYVSASEDLTVHNALNIYANAQSSTSNGYKASANLYMSNYDGGLISVEDYSNYAEASNNHAMAFQTVGSLMSSDYGTYFDLVEESSDIRNRAYHVFQSYYGPVMVSDYSAKAEVTKGAGANVAASFQQVIGDTLFDWAEGSYKDNLNDPYGEPDYYSGVSFSAGGASLGAYSTKASSKGVKTTAESTLEVIGIPAYFLDYSAYTSVYGRNMPIYSPGTYSAVAEFDGKTVNVDIAPA